MLTSNEKRQLKALASTLETKYQVGKNEISDTVVAMLDKALTAKELIKIDVMNLSIVFHRVFKEVVVTEISDSFTDWS